MTFESVSFIDLIPLTTVAERHVKTPIQLKRLFVAGIRKKIFFFAVNQSTKRVHFFREGYEYIEHLSHERRIIEKEKQERFVKGDMFPITTFYHFDRLFKGALNERDLFRYIEDFHDIILINSVDDHYPSGLIDPRSSEYKDLTHPSDFKDIGFEHVYIRARDVSDIADFLEKETGPKASKQVRRENIFIDWLKNKDELEVSYMRKEDVWGELRKIDSTLFNAGSKHFFRDQKIITFKAGRKPQQTGQ